MSDFRFRDLTADDIDPIRALYTTYRPAGVKLDRLRAEHATCPGVVVMAGERLVGFAYCYSFAPDIYELANIFVHRDFRDAGLGRTLLERICERAAPTHNAIVAVNSLKAETTEPKRRPDGLYARGGFDVVLQTPHATVYAKSLSPAGSDGG